jgi:predicted unusual protein kinase regulating ubiquinone biosynthesis (AarF/ABC1/UbiB family)
MSQPNFRNRYLRITTFFAGVILRFVWWEFILARIGLRKLTRRTRPERFRREAVRFRALAIRMGGVMIKVGQFLSSRLDVLPPEVTDELSGLQDEVPAEAFSDIRALAEAELGASLESQFEWVDESPLAAASLGQVHRARLNLALSEVEGVEDEASGARDVVVKVQRPFIEQIVEVDLSALQRVGGWLMRYRPIRDHADVPALLREFSGTVREEIDYLLEAQNAETFYENFRGDKSVRVPRVVRSRTTKRVLTLEDVFAIKITDYDAITSAGVERGEVANKLLATYLKQIFEDGFFHADPHPGNLFVTPRKTKKGAVRWQLTFVDFGMVGRLPVGAQDGLREMLIGVGTKDASRVVKSYQMLGMMLPGADLKLIEQAEAQVFDRFWGMSMSELRKTNPDEIRKFAHQYRDLMLNMPFQVPNNLLMLVRTVAILSGMCAGLDPNFNLWTQLAPYARKLIAENAPSGFDAILDQLGDTLQQLIALPSQASRMLSKMEQGELTVQSPQLGREVQSLTRSVDRLTAGVILTAFSIGGVMLVNAGNLYLGYAFFSLGALTFLWILASRRK